tara:strand:+ start:353 stop:538 length:186 start_codon:yes stop_codon:yes gene_type:complete
MNEVGRSAVEGKFKVAVEETVINYYLVEADSEQDAMDNYMEGVCVSTKPKQEQILWVKEVV